MFSFHDYAKDIDKPIQFAINAQLKQRSPIVMTEFGADTLSIEKLHTLLHIADQHQLSWTYWTYTNNPNFKFSTGTGLPLDPRKQALVYDASKPLTGDNVKWNKLLALTRAYPQAVAGHNIKYSYDPATQTFHLHYSTNKQTKEKDNACGITQIFFPSRANKLNIISSGATLVSQHDGILRFKNKTHTNSVTIKISPN